MNPPWLEFPEIKAGCMGWRMGHGEGYLTKFNEFLAKCSNEEIVEYIKKYPIPADWKPFFRDTRGVFSDAED